jgi:predicted RNA binding protein with dsRBD fold (UPF0201 family)
MRITADRRIEVNEDVEVTEAAKKVLEAMQLMLDNQRRTWVGLTKEERHKISMDNRPYCADIMVAHEEELKRRNT